MRVACLYFSSPQNTQMIAEVFYRATPQIMLRGDQALFLEISHNSVLFSEKSFLRRAAATLKRLSLTASIAIADDVPTALSLAAFKMNNKERLPIESLRFYADPLHKDLDSVKQITKTILILKQLGVYFLGDFLKLPLKEVASRFGTQAMLVYLRAKKENEVLWTPFIPSEVVSEKHEFDLEHPVENLEPVYFLLKAMLDKVVLRLRGRGKRMRQFDIVLKQEYGLEDLHYKVGVVLQLPYVNNKVIFQIAKEKLEASVRSKPLTAPISEFSVIVTEEAPYFMNQKELFNQNKEENEESFFQLVSRVATKLGQSSVFFARPRESYLPEKNWLRIAEPQPQTAPLGDPLAERPLRLFSQPIEVAFHQNRIFVSDFSEEIESIGNREVVFSDWWENPLERIYYRLVTKTGRHLWLFKTTEGHFLHGAFD